MQVVDGDGCPVLGLTTVASTLTIHWDFQGKGLYLFEHARGGEVIDLWADGACNDLFGEFKNNGVLKEAYIAVCDKTMKDLYYDFEVLYELLQYIPGDKARHHSIAAALMEASKELRDFTEKEAKRARDILAPELAKKGGSPSLTVSCRSCPYRSGMVVAYP